LITLAALEQHAILEAGLFHATIMARRWDRPGHWRRHQQRIQMLYPITLPEADSANDLVGYIDAAGTDVVPATYVAGTFFSAGLAAVVDDAGLTAFIDLTGRVAIPAKCTGLGLFHEGLCAIGGGVSVGYIDRRGDWAVAAEYAVCGQFSEGLAFVSRNGRSFGIVNREGHVVVEPRYDRTGVFHNGLGAVSFDEQWGYVDPTGALVVPCIFHGPRAQPFVGGWAGVNVDSAWGFVDRYGTWLVKPKYEDVKRFSEGFAPFKTGGKWGVLSSTGTVHVEPTFDSLGEFECGMAPASLDGKSGFVSRLYLEVRVIGMDL
jgi:hypothetical protein